MNREIYIFVKIFDNEKYAKDFIEGKIYANRLSFFKKIEESESANRGDRHEGVVGFYQQDQIQVFIGDHLVEGIAKPVFIQMDHHDFLNIFCIYAAHSGDFKKINSENLLELRKWLKIPNECLKLGKHAVLIKEPKEFIRRMEKAATKKMYNPKHNFVEYYEPAIFHGRFTEEEAVFRKSKDYEHQKEYRFVFDTGTDGDSPLEFEIGSIKDIAILCKSSEINTIFSVKLPNGD